MMSRIGARTPNRRTVSAEGRRGFTLIELMVSVGILALLVAILVPALNKARTVAKTTFCAASLRELGKGWQMYADVSDGVLVPGRMYNRTDEHGRRGKDNPQNMYDVGNGLKYRPRFIATMGAQVGVFAFDQPSTTDDRQDYDSEVYVCPAVREWRDERNAAYGYNYQFLGNARRTGERFHNFPVRGSAVSQPSGTVVVADSMGTAAGFGRFERRAYDPDGDGPKAMGNLGNHGWSLDPPRLSDTSDHGTGDQGSRRTAVDPRHGGRVNAVYADGHTETTTDRALGYRTHNDGRYVDLDPYKDVEGIGPPHNRAFSGSGRDMPPPPLPGRESNQCPSE
jgi:prepilin-type N-terminal cleavage/methylation domain-containing protein/prepilin-type processing-associated H-X9-DG protein